MARKGPADQDRAEAIRRLLSGMARGDDVFDLAATTEKLHPRHDTFPGEVFMRLSADALKVAGVGRDDPIVDDHVIPQARGGIQPDLLDEAAWWQARDFWWYAWLLWLL